MRTQQILQQARKYQKPMVSFLREMVALPSESGQERRVVQRIRKEMSKLKCFDRVWTDPMGNLLARVGNGPRLIAIDAHVDTVGVGDPAEWKHDPYKGKVTGGVVYGRGAGDQEGAIPAMVYGARIIKDFGLLHPDCTLLLTCTVMEEDCDGLCWQYIVQEDGIRPECVVVTDSTNCRILRGQRGRMEMGVRVKGRSCHGSMPHKGDNAVYKIARIVREIEKLNTRLKKNKFLGNGTVTVSYVDCKTPSMCAVPGEAYIHLDRRLTLGESKRSAMSEVRDAIRRALRAGDTTTLSPDDRNALDELVAEKSVDDAQLRALARDRAEFLRTYLVEEYGAQPDQIEIADPLPSRTEGGSDVQVDLIGRR